MLDEDDGGAAVADPADELDGVVDLPRREAGQHFVEQHQPRPRRQRARQLEELALVQVQVVRQGVGLVLQAGEVQPLPRLAGRLPLIERRAAEHRHQRHVLQHAHVRERPRDLVGAGDAGARDAVRLESRQFAALEADLAAAGGEMPADHVDEGRLARAVGAQQAEDLARGRSSGSPSRAPARP